MTELTLIVKTTQTAPTPARFKLTGVSVWQCGGPVTMPKRWAGIGCKYLLQLNCGDVEVKTRIKRSSLALNRPEQQFIEIAERRSDNRIPDTVTPFWVSWRLDVFFLFCFAAVASPQNSLNLSPRVIRTHFSSPSPRFSFVFYRHSTTTRPCSVRLETRTIAHNQKQTSNPTKCFLVSGVYLAVFLAYPSKM